MLEEKISQLKEKVVKYSNLVEAMLSESIEGILEKNIKTLKKVKGKLEDIANNAEIDIDELCLSAIALYQPEAKNLRLIMMIYKMNNDMERMADLTVNIADSGLYIIEKPPVKPLVDIPRMANEARKMLVDAITSFINEDNLLAMEVLKSDDNVDHLRDQILRELITYMLADPSVIERSMHLIRIARNIERLADLATNIAEDVIFITEGKLIRHDIRY